MSTNVGVESPLLDKTIQDEQAQRQHGENVNSSDLVVSNDQESKEVGFDLVKIVHANGFYTQHVLLNDAEISKFKLSAAIVNNKIFLPQTANKGDEINQRLVSCYPKMVSIDSKASGYIDLFNNSIHLVAYNVDTSGLRHFKVLNPCAEVKSGEMCNIEVKCVEGVARKECITMKWIAVPRTRKHIEKWFSKEYEKSLHGSFNLELESIGCNSLVNNLVSFA